MRSISTLMPVYWDEMPPIQRKNALGNFRIGAAPNPGAVVDPEKPNLDPLIES